MKIGLFTSGYQRNPLEHCFQDAKRMEYDYIELWGARPHAYAPDLKSGEIKEVRRLIEKYEIPVLGYTPEHNAYPYNFMIGSELQRRDAIDSLKLCLDLAGELEAEYMLISPGHAGYQATYKEIWNRMTKAVRELGEHAEKVRVKLVVEPLTPYESNSFCSANDAVELLRRVDSPYVVSMCDLVPPFVQFESIMEYLTKLGDKMYHFHIIDGQQGTDSHIMPGEGNIPLRELFVELRDAGYKGNATIELVTGYMNEPRLYARRAIDNVRAYMNAE